MKNTTADENLIMALCPKSEATVIRNKYKYRGINFINDRGYPCEYRLELDGKDLKIMVKYYKGRLLAFYGIQ